MKTLVKSTLKRLGLDVRWAAPAPIRHIPDDPHEAQHFLLERLGVTRPIIFDVGGHYGESVAQYKRLFPRGTIYSFEPFPDSLRTLRERFGTDPSVVIIPSAVSDTAGERDFFLSPHSGANSLLARPSSRRYYRKAAELTGTTRVRAITLDDFTHDNGVTGGDIIKIDIQGGELLALSGAQRVLEHAGISLVYSEIMFAPFYKGGPLLNTLWTFLERFGFSLFNVYNLSWATNGQLRYGDGLFVSERVRKEVLDAFESEP